MPASPRPNALYFFYAIGAIIAITAGFRFWLPLNNPTIAALMYLLVILVTAAVSTLWTAVVASVLAVLCLNYFFMPPVGTFTIADPQDWGALFAFLAISIAVAMGIERVQLLEERKTAQLARQSEELKSALLASLAHDLRTPLTTIRVAASNLQGSWLTEEQRREQSELVLAEVERLTRLFQNILEMARIEAGAISAEYRWVHPSEIVEAARALVEHTLRQHAVEVTAAGDGLVRLDPRLTASALAHLLENAAQYSPPGSTISVSAQALPDELSVTVRDRGAGISAPDFPHLFQRFYRGTATKGHVSGTGMGLSIARGLLAAEQGRIWAENCADGGSRFTIAVPVERREAADAGTT